MSFHRSYIAAAIVGVAIVGGAVIAALQSTNPSQSAIVADAPVGTAQLSIEPTTSNVKVGNTFTLDVKLDTGNASDTTSGVDVVLGYDPTFLEVVDADAKAPGVQVALGDKLFALTPANDVVLATGTINVSLAIAPTDSGVAAHDVTIVKITFQAKEAGESPLVFMFTPGDTRDANVIKMKDSRDLLSRITNGTVTVSQ